MFDRPVQKRPDHKSTVQKRPDRSPAHSIDVVDPVAAAPAAAPATRGFSLADFAITAERPNRDGLPADLRHGIEALSGIAMDDVRVHRNSARPAALGAHAYAQGSHIHLGPGQEHNLPHEAWHVVQQKQGRVRVTVQLKSGVAINDDAALEREADVMGRQAEQDSLTSPGRHVRQVPAARPVVSSAPIQGAWRVIMNGSRTSYFWADEKESAQPPAPATWSGYHLATEPPKAGSYYLVGTQRAQRGKEPALTIEQWTTQYGASMRAPSDSYNPFGRFMTSKVSSFVRSPKIDAATAAEIRNTLKERDPTFQAGSKTHTKMVEQMAARDQPGKSFINRHGYPVAIATREKKVLAFVSSNEFGATYSDVIDAPPRALLNPALVSPASHLPWAKGVDDTIGFMDEAVGSDSAAVPEHIGFQTADSDRVTPDALKYWHGRKRDKQQHEVMGVSARDAAQSAGFNPAEGKGWEWLHLIAHSMGGIKRIGPQVPQNLVAGTSECNTQMIVVEEFLKDLVMKSGGTAQLKVGVTMFDAARHIGGKISYDFAIDIEGKSSVYHWEFDCLSRSRPVVAENRQLRVASRAVHGLNTQAEEATAETPNAEDPEQN